MKLQIIIFSSLFLFSLAFASCQKEIEQQLSPRPQHMSEGSILDRYIEFDTTEVIGLDTISIFSFIYDNNNRISQINEKWFDHGTLNVSVYTSTNYLYNGTDTLPGLVVKNSLANGFSLVDSLFLQYNSSNMISRDSGRKYEQGVLKSYFTFHYDEIAPWKYHVYGVAFDIVSGTFMQTNEIALTRNFTNGNVTQSYDSVYNSIPFANYSILQSSYLYDNKPNPFKKLALRYPDLHSDFESGLFSWYAFNNPVKFTRTTYTSNSLIPATNIHDITYKYNSLGYPIDLSVSKNGLPYFSAGFKILLYYK